MARTGKKLSFPRSRAPPEAASDSKHTVDDLFQILVHAHGKKPELARPDILKQLQDGALLIELHIKGGVRSIGPVRPPTPEEQMEERRTGIVAEARYSTTPPEGVTLSVDPQSWEGVLLLRIRDKSLVIEPGCNFDYPWDAYSFSIADWSLIEQLWPNPNRAGSAPASKLEDSHASTSEEFVKRSAKSWVAHAIKQRPDQFVGLGPQPAAKLLAGWMKEGHFSPEKVVSWKRIKNILTDDPGLLPPRKSTRKSKSARKVPGNRPRKT
jgi:hypothetical protein